MDRTDAIDLAEDSRPFNDSMLGAWTNFLKHFPSKRSSWRTMSPAELTRVLEQEWNEVRQGYADMANASSFGPDDIIRLMYELDDLAAATALLRGRLKWMLEEGLMAYNAHHGYKCENCLHLMESIPCNTCPGGEAWPCAKDPKKQHMNPECGACWEFEKKTFQDNLDGIEIEESSP